MHWLMVMRANFTVYMSPQPFLMSLFSLDGNLLINKLYICFSSPVSNSDETSVIDSHRISPAHQASTKQAAFPFVDLILD
jgi:hypothetical protein